MKFLIKIFILGLIALLAYNYFLGTPNEKQQSREIVNKLEELGNSIADLLKSEKVKYDEGKYDDALGKIGSVIQSLKEQSSKIDLKDELEKLDLRKHELLDRLEKYKDDGGIVNEEDQRNLDKDLEALLKDIKKYTESTSIY